MKFIKQLTETEEITLTEMHKNSWVHRQRQRAHILLLSHRGFQIGVISKVVALDRDTISGLFDHWEKIGISALYDRNRSGRPPIFTDSEQQHILSQIAEEPRMTKSTAATIKEKTGKCASLETIKRVLKKNDYKWKRVRKKPAGKPEKHDYEEKKAKIEKLKQKAEQGEIDLLFSDESGFSLTPCVPYAWQPKGEIITLPTAKSSRLNVLGFLAWSQNSLTSIVIDGSINADCVIASIDNLYKTVEK